MLKLFALAAAAAASLAVAAPTATAATITPVSAVASNTFPFWNDYKAENLINGSGLSGGLHDANYYNMWMTDLSVDAATLVFDLGGVFDLTAIDVWNYNFGTPGFASTIERGAKAFKLSLSLDGTNYTQALSGEFSVAAGQPLAAERMNLSGTARYVQLELSGNHQSYPETYGYAPIGLSEVRFQGAAVPEPGAWALMILGFGAAGSVLRQRRSYAAA